MVTRGQLARIADKLKNRNRKTIAFLVPYCADAERVETVCKKAIRDNDLDREGVTVVFVIDFANAA